MPILSHVSLGELCSLTGTVPATLRSDRLRKQVVAAFAEKHHPAMAARVLLADGIAWGVRDELTRAGMARRAAANTVLNFWPEWTEALSRVEHWSQPFVFSVAEREDHAWWCGCGLADKLPAFVAEQSSPLRKLYCVNVAQLMLDMQERGTKAGLDMSSARFMLPPDDPSLVQWLREAREHRAATLRRFDPLHAKAPPPPSAAQRRAIEAMSCSLH